MGALSHSTRIADFIAAEVTAIARAECAVFCGAGISVRSGLPAAGQLISSILRQLPMTDVDRATLSASPLPFEAFLDTLGVGADLSPLLELFTGGEPNANHHVLAKLARKGYVRTICTTNFDLLIERALVSEGLERGKGFNVYYRADQFDAIAWDAKSVSVIKLHGSVEDFQSIVATLRQVATRNLHDSQRRLIDKIFSTGPHQAVLVLGYSCSDIFDISPQIEAIGKHYKTIAIIEHTVYSDPSGEGVEPVQLRTDHNPFRAAENGLRVRLATEKFIEALWTFVGENFKAESGTTPWNESIVRWANDLRANGEDAPSRVVGRVFESVADASRAERYFQNALEAAQSRNDRRSQGQYLADLGRIATSVADYPKAVVCHSESLAIAYELGDKRGIASELGNLGNAYHNLGRGEEAIDHHTRSLTLAREIGNKSIEAHELGNLALCHRSHGRYPQAAELHREAIRVHQSTGDKLGEGRQLGNLGLCLRRMRDYESAKTCHQQGLRILQQLGNRRGEALELGNLGLVCGCLGEHKQAVACFRRALPIARAIRDRLNEANQLGNLADAFVATGQYRRAVWLGKGALVICEEVKHVREQAVHHGTLAKAYLGLNNPHHSLHHAEIAFGLFSSLFGPEHEMTKDVQQTMIQARAAQPTAGSTSEPKPA